jgi:hypothetical protein
MILWILLITMGCDERQKLQEITDQSFGVSVHIWSIPAHHRLHRRSRIVPVSILGSRIPEKSVLNIRESQSNENEIY